jgi:hypothetical protein
MTTSRSISQRSPAPSSKSPGSISWEAPRPKTRKEERPSRPPEEETETRSRTPDITGAIIDLQEEVDLTRHIPLVPVDPLIVAGKATPGADIALRNPDMQGWPVIGAATADAHGLFRIEVSDASLFHRGDRVWVTAKEAQKDESEGALLDTFTFTERTTRNRTYYGSQLVEDSARIDRFTHDLKADDRSPYFDASLVKFELGKGEVGFTLQLVGKERAVPPGTTVHLAGHAALADKQGRFELNVSGLSPGTAPQLTLTDVHGRNSTVPVRLPGFGLDAALLVEGARWSKEGSLCVSTAPFLTPGQAVRVRNARTGAIQELQADAKGELRTTLSNVQPFDVLQWGVSESARQATRIRELVVLPQGKGPALQDTDSVEVTKPSFEASLAKARLKDGIFKLPAITDLPPFGELEIRDAKDVLVRNRADADGTVASQKLEGIARGQKLQLFTYDAAGRRMGVDVIRYWVPEGRDPAELPTVRRRSENSTVQELASLVGSGLVDAPPLEASVSHEVSTRLNPDDWCRVTGARTNQFRTELSGDLQRDQWPEAAEASSYASMTLGRADWGTGERNLRFNFYDGSSSHMTELHVPLPIDDERVEAHPEPMPGPADALALLRRSIAFLILARDNAQSPGDAAYDTPLVAAKTLLFALDREASKLSPADAEKLRNEAQSIVSQFENEPLDAHVGVVPEGAVPVSSHVSVDRFWQA